MFIGYINKKLFTFEELKGLKTFQCGKKFLSRWSVIFPHGKTIPLGYPRIKLVACTSYA